MLVREAVLCRLEEGGCGSGESGEVETRPVYVRDVNFLSLLWRFFPFTYRLPDRSPILLQVCRERQWRGLGEVTEEDEYMLPSCYQHSWNLWWRTSTLKLGSWCGTGGVGGVGAGGSSRNRFKAWQTINHIPNAAHYCRKDVLVRYFRRMKSTYGNIFDFCPTSFNLPMEYSQLITGHRKRRSSLSITTAAGSTNGALDTGTSSLILNLNQTFGGPSIQDKVIWIAKPVGKSQGRGIFVFERFSELRYDDQYVVQEYIHRPLLINGYKWDLRLYVIITCYNPLTIYSYEEGIARFATKKYDLSSLDDCFSHLTNTSLNKQSPTYYKQKETVGVGSKWTLGQLRKYFAKEGIDDYLLWQRIWSILVLTVIGEGKIISQQKNQSRNNSNNANCNWMDRGFQFLGFDVLVDCNMKPHLLEVNLHPGLGVGSDRSSVSSLVDMNVKVPLLHDMFDLLGLPDGRKFPDYYNSARHFSSSSSKEELCSKILEATSSAAALENRPLGFAPSSPSYFRNHKPMASSLHSQHHYHSFLYHNYKRPWKLSSDKKCRVRRTNSRLKTRSPLTSIDPDSQDPSSSGNLSIVGRTSLLRDKQDADRRLVSSPTCPSSGSNENDQDTFSYEDDDVYGEKDAFARSQFSPVVVHIPFLRTSRRKLHLPINGPGLTFPPRQWKTNAPTTCGKWVKIFPFNNATKKSSSFDCSGDGRDAINQVGLFLQSVKEVVGPEKSSQTVTANNSSCSPLQRRIHEDAYFDTALQKLLTTKVWHPALV